LTGAWQQVRNGAFGTPAGWDRQETWQLGGSFDFGVVKLFGQYTNVATKASTDTETDMFGLGASMPIGAGKLIGQYGQSKADVGSADTTHKVLSLGYDYNLSKNTDVYAVYMNDKVSDVDGGNSFAAGMRLRF
jgi:predicted porin